MAWFRRKKQIELKEVIARGLSRTPAVVATIRCNTYDRTGYVPGDVETRRILEELEHENKAKEIWAAWKCRRDNSCSYADSGWVSA